MSDKFILDKHGNPKPEPDLTAWAVWLEKADRRVAQDVIGKSRVSTVFLGLNHALAPNATPIVWETMVFGGKLDQHMERCSGNREQAEAMHQKICEKVRHA